MSFRKPIHMPFRKLILSFTLTVWKCSKLFIPPQTDGVICFSFNIGCWESVWFSSDEKKHKKGFIRSKRSHLVYFIQSQSELSQNDTNKQSQHTEKPALSLRWGIHRSLHRTFFRPEALSHKRGIAYGSSTDNEVADRMAWSEVTPKTKTYSSSEW